MERKSFLCQGQPDQQIRVWLPGTKALFAWSPGVWKSSFKVITHVVRTHADSVRTVSVCVFSHTYNATAIRQLLVEEMLGQIWFLVDSVPVSLWAHFDFTQITASFFTDLVCGRLLAGQSRSRQGIIISMAVRWHLGTWIWVAFNGVLLYRNCLV